MFKSPGKGCPGKGFSILTMDHREGRWRVEGGKRIT
jgi:hypothetical protein